ncbi:hypothetical protein C0J52_13831 [Blattella germanica]|nr:hypothetical protein C0J52_13831 [Blattella germanica]
MDRYMPRSNKRLLQELLESQRSYQSLLKQGLEEHKLQIQVLSQMMQQLNLVAGGMKSRSDTGGGVELRVWKAILKWRREHRAPANTDHAAKNHRLSRNSTHSSTDKLAAFRSNSSESPDATD